MLGCICRNSFHTMQLVGTLASLGHTERRRAVLGHTLNTQTLMKTKKSHNVLSKFTILCWASFIAMHGLWAMG